MTDRVRRFECIYWPWGRQILILHFVQQQDINSPSPSSFVSGFIHSNSEKVKLICGLASDNDMWERLQAARKDNYASRKLYQNIHHREGSVMVIRQWFIIFTFGINGGRIQHETARTERTASTLFNYAFTFKSTPPFTTKMIKWLVHLR
jgi:hypothetical protein